MPFWVYNFLYTNIKHTMSKTILLRQKSFPARWSSPTTYPLFTNMWLSLKNYWKYSAWIGFAFTNKDVAYLRKIKHLRIGHLMKKCSFDKKCQKQLRISGDSTSTCPSEFPKSPFVKQRSSFIEAKSPFPRIIWLNYLL